jgi:CO dehydrogenase/acetyl-CoA synthase gamma subunit (corrinoid Fe-S protein)
MSNEIKDFMDLQFSSKFCSLVTHALKLKFPNIKNLSVDMDSKGVAHVIFDETEYTREQVESFLSEFRKNGHKA